MGLLRLFRKSRTETPGAGGPSHRRGHRDPERRRRRAERRRGADGRRTEDLYQADLDRHLWALGSPSRRKGRRTRRRLARVAASAAGMMGAAGLSYWLYRRIRASGGEAEEPSDARADAGD